MRESRVDVANRFFQVLITLHGRFSLYGSRFLCSSANDVRPGSITWIEHSGYPGTRPAAPEALSPLQPVCRLRRYGLKLIR